MARTLLASTQPDVFFWFPHIYWWPDALLPHKRWMVYVRAYAQKARLVNAREYVDRFFDDPRNLWLFERLPSIYNGFVCRDLLERIRHRIGGYFYDEVADVSMETPPPNPPCPLEDTKVAMLPVMVQDDKVTVPEP